jgi:hypothetical protein
MAEKIPNSVLLERYAGHPEAASQLLSRRQQQTLYCLRIATTPMPCPNCLTTVSEVDCSGVELDEYDADGYTRYDYQCPVCDTHLVDVVPFQGQIHWRRKHPNVVKEAAPAGKIKDTEVT